jgi:hypothetical protein
MCCLMIKNTDFVTALTIGPANIIPCRTDADICVRIFAHRPDDGGCTHLWNGLL